MGLLIALIGIGFTAVLCSKRFHDFAQDWLLARKNEPITKQYRKAKSKTSRKTLRRSLQASAAFVLIFSVWIGLSFVHNNVIPLPMAGQILSAFDPDTKVWEEKIEKGALGDLGEAHEDWAESRGLGYDHSRYWQEELWANWRGYMDALLLLGLFVISLISWFIYNMQKRLHADKEKRTPTSIEIQEPARRKRRVRKTRKTKIRVLGQDQFHKVLTRQDQP